MRKLNLKTTTGNAFALHWAADKEEKENKGVTELDTPTRKDKN